MAEQARFSLQTVIAEAETEPFTFDGPDGEPLELPHASCVTLRQADRIDRGEFQAVLQDIAPKAADVILDVPGFAANALIEAWFAHAGIDLGELLASSTSSTSTGRPSKRTSRPAAARSPRSARRR